MLLTDPLTIFFFIIGLVFGSFGNVLIERLPKNKKINGKSKCPKCNHTIKALDLIPVLSFFLLGGKCRYCKAAISIQYPLVELASGILFVIATIIMSVSIPVALLLGIILWLLLIISVIDAKTHGIPDVLNISFVLLSIVYSLLTGLLPIVAPLIAAGFFFAQWKLSEGKWVGSGDIILAAGIGFLLAHWIDVVLMIGASYIIGAVVALWLILTQKKSKKEHLGFGPFLALGTFVVLMWGDVILGLLF